MGACDWILNNAITLYFKEFCELYELKKCKVPRDLVNIKQGGIF